MQQTLRVLWRGLRWNQPLTVNWDPITADSVVHVSVSEAKRIYYEVPGFGTPQIQRFMGAARIEVRNVSPYQGGVTFFIYVDWDEPLDITTDITVLGLPVLVHDVFAGGQSWNLSGQSLGQRTHQFLTNNLSKLQAKKLQQLILEDSMDPAQITVSARILSSQPKKKSKKRSKL